MSARIELNEMENGGFVVFSGNGCPEDPPQRAEAYSDAFSAIEALAARIAPAAIPAETLVARHVAFTFRTFGPGRRLLGTLAHIHKELDEIEAAPFDLEEWVDVILLALNGAARHGFGAAEIVDGIAGKIVKNEARQWPDWRAAPYGAPIEHIRSDGRRD